MLFNLIRSGIHPRPGEPTTAWYDRIIRAVGGTMLLLFFLVAVFLGWVTVLGTH